MVGGPKVNIVSVRVLYVFFSGFQVYSGILGYTQVYSGIQDRMHAGLHTGWDAELDNYIFILSKLVGGS